MTESSSKALLAVFAHPDDETAVGPLLVHYAKRGVAVYLALVTSGQKGNAHTDIPSGERLGRIREAEARAACAEYGIQEPFVLGEQDGTLASMARSDAIAACLHEIISQVRPNVLITFGPDGLTGHADHRAVSNIVTELFQMPEAYGGGEFVPRKLYYVVWPASMVADISARRQRRLLGAEDSYITTVIDVRDGLEATSQAIRCHKTQFPPDFCDTIDQMMREAMRGNVYLRLALSRERSRRKAETDIFA